MLQIVQKYNFTRGKKYILNGDTQYKNLVNKILTTGEKKMGRNGEIISVFGEKMEFSLENYNVPILTTKKLAWKTCLKELLWFVKGETDNKILREQNVKIWDGNASEEFKKSRGLNYKSEGDLGPIYGHQWRHFNAEYSNCNTDYSNKGVDQLQNVVNMLSHPTEKFSRRIFLSAWNPCQLDEMVLPPCHVSSHYIVNSNNELSCAVYQRSGDVGLGIPFNIASYSMLTCMLAKHCDLKPGKFIHFIGDAHIYKEHVEGLKQQIKRRPKDPPLLNILKQNSLEKYEVKHFKLLNYDSHDTVHLKMIA